MFGGVLRSIYCKRHAENGAMKFSVRFCLLDGCMKIPNYNFLGNKIGLYCNLHAEDGMVNVNTSRVDKAARRVPTYDLRTACAGIKRNTLDDAVTSPRVEKLCEATGCRNWSRWGGVDSKHPTHCLDHVPLEHGLGVQTAAVEIAHTQEDSRSSSALDSRAHLDDSCGGDGIAHKRTRRHWLYRRPLSP